jgi:hypothetical protein
MPLFTLIFSPLPIAVTCIIPNVECFGQYCLWMYQLAGERIYKYKQALLEQTNQHGRTGTGVNYCTLAT